MEDLVKIAYARGYRVSASGEILNPEGKVLNGTTKGRKNMKYKSVAIKIETPEGKIKKYNCPIHRIQAYQKYGDAVFMPGIIVRHLDGNRFNNSYENISIGTFHDNRLDMSESDRRYYAQLAARENPLRYDKEKILSIKRDRSAGMSYAEIMKKYAISSKGTISYICNHDYLF